MSKDDIRLSPAALGLLLVVLSLAACARSDGATVGPTQVVPTSTPTPPPHDAATATRIRSRGFLRVGVRYDLEPFGYVTDQGGIAGFDVDLGRELARRWLGDAQAVQFRQVRSDTAIEHLQAGDVDLVIAALAHTKGREAGADFSLPYFIDGQALLVRAVDADAIRRPEDLAGRPVGVSKWNEARETIRTTVPFTLALQTYDRFDTAASALGRREVDAVADLRRRLFRGGRILTQTETSIVGQYTTVPVAIAFPQNEPFLADLIHLTLQEMVVDGTYTDLYARWFAPESPPEIERWPGEEVPDLAEAPAVASVPDTIDAIQSRGRLVVSLIPNRPPFAYVDANGTPRGYEVDLVRQMAEWWLGDPTAVEFIPTKAGTGRDLLQRGEAQLLVGAIAHTRSAELELDFSLGTYAAGVTLLVRAGTQITEVGSLRGQQVAVVEGSGGWKALLTAAREADISTTMLPKRTLEEAVASLEEEQVTAVAGDRVDLLGSAHRSPGLAVPPLRVTKVPLAIGLPPGDSAFRDLVNLTLQAMKADGRLDTLYATWFDDAPPAMESWTGAPYRELQLKVTPLLEAGG